MKKIFFILSILISFVGVSQPVIQRSGPGNTVQDARVMGQYNMFIPRYLDTSAANTYKGIDSAAAIIYTYTGNTLWYRQSSPKKWVRLASGDGSNLGNSDLTQTDPQRTFNGDGGRLTFTNFNDLVFASFDRLQFLPLSSGVPTDSLLTWNNSTGEVRKISPSNIAGPCAPIVTILSDSTLSVCQCLKPDDCDTLEVSGGINNYYFTSDTTLIIVNNPTLVCDTIENADPALPDSIICKPIYTFDTLTFNNLAASFIFQNGLIQVAPKIIEQGGVFNRHTVISGRNAYNFRYDSLNFTVRGPYGLGQPIDTLFGPQFSFLPRKAALVAGYFNSQSVGQTDADVGPFTVNLQVNNTVNGNYSYAHGISNIVPGYVNTAWGEDNQLIGNRSTAWGQENTIPSASYNATIAGGWKNIAAAHYPFVTGVYNQSYTYGGTVIGTYNDTTSKANEANSSIIFLTGRIFEIGNGTGVGGLRSNAMTVYNDRGKTIIGGHLVDSAAQLRLEATNLAFKPNSGNTTQMNSVVVPYNGLLYWNTDSLALCEYTDGEWRKVDRLGNTNTSIGGGYEVAVTGTNNVKSLFATSPITLDSTLNPNGITIGFDGSGVQDSTAFYYLSQLNDTTAVFHRRDGTADTLVISILQGGGGGGGGGSISLAAVGTSSNANAATLTGSVLNLEPANATYPGVVVSGAQTFPTGIKTFQRDIKVYNSIRIGRGVGDIVTNFVASPDALSGNTTGYQNVGIGYLAMSANTSGAQNVGISYQALQNNTTGGGNVAIGSSALKQNVSGDWNVAIGVGALQNNVDDGYSVAVGAGSLGANISTFRNTAVGYAAMADAQPDAYDNAAFGFNALRYLTTGQKNTAVGSAAMEEATTGYQNAFVGQDAALHLRTGYWNVGLGWLAGSLNQNGHSNIYIGTSTGRSVSSGDQNIFIGTEAGYNASQAVSVTNSIGIGNAVYTTASNQIKIGNTSHTSIYLRGTLYWDDDPGTAGYCLVSQGAGLPAIWAACGGGGGGSVISFTFTDGQGFDGTVTNPTTTPTLSLTTTIADTRVIYSSSGALGSSAGFVFDGTSMLTVGVSGSTLGKLKLTGSGSGSVTVQPAVFAGTWTMTLPDNAGTNGYFLQTDGNGITSWAEVSGSGTVTNVATGYGLSGGPITTTGTILVDSATIFPQLLNTIALTTTGSSGAATWNPTTRVLNIPQYSGGVIGEELSASGDGVNLTISLGGTPGTALLEATSITLGWTGTLGATRGGTGFGSYAVGDILYASSTTALSKRPAGAEGYCLVMSGGVPVWAACGGSGPTTTPISSLVSGVATNDIDNRGYIQVWRWDSLANNAGLNLKANTTHSDDDVSLFTVEVYGANSQADTRTPAAYFTNTHTGTNSTNVGVWTTASGGTKNYGLISIGDVGINNEDPLEDLSIGSPLHSSTGTIGLYGLTSGKVVVTVADAAGSWTLTLPANDGDNGQVLTTNGSGVTSWATPSASGVTDFIFTDGNGFDGTVATSTTTPTLSLTTTVADLRVMYSSNGAITGDALMTYDAGGVLTLGATGSGLGQLRVYGNTAGRVIIRPNSSGSNWTFQLPTSAGTANYFLQTDGNGVTTWAAGNAGTVTSVTATDANGFDFTVATGTTTPVISLTTTVTNTRLFYSNSGAVAGVSGVTSDGTNVTAGSANLRATRPRITTSIDDINGTKLIGFNTFGASSVNYLAVSNGLTGSGPILGAEGSDANIMMSFQAKGTGIYSFQATSTSPTQIYMYEDTDNGNNYVAFQSPTSLAASNLYTLPTGYPGVSGYVLSSDVNGVMSWTAASAGTVTNFIFTDGSGFDGTVTLSTTTPTLALTTTLTQGSVQFIGASGALSQDNTNFFYDNTNDFLGIGTNSPNAALHVVENVSEDYAARIVQQNAGGFGLIVQGDEGSAELFSVNATGINNRFAVAGSGAVLFNNQSGTSGQVLTSQGSGAPPTWTNPGTGTVTSVIAGSGMNFATFTTSGTIVMGTPSSITTVSTNSASGTTHTHALDLGGTAQQFLLGNDALASLPANDRVYFTSAGVMTGVAGFTFDGTSALTLGLNGTATGDLLFRGATGSTVVTLTVQDNAGVWTMKLPTSAGTSGYVLTTDGTGVTTWSCIGCSAANFGDGLLTATSPLFITSIDDANGNEWLKISSEASAVNEFTIANAPTGSNPILSATGGDANIGIDLAVKAAGSINITGNTTQAGIIKIFEDTDNGTNFSAFTVGTQSADLTYTLPTAYPGGNGYALVSTTAGVMSWSAVGAGSVTDFVFTDANGFDGTVATSTSTPTLSLTTTVTDTRVMVSSSGAITGYAGMVFNGSGRLSLGAAGTADGSIKLFGNTDGSVTITAATTGDNWGMTMPASLGADGTVLTNAVSGVTTWSNIGTLPFAYVAKTSVYTATASDYTINCTSGTFEIDLPAVASVPVGKVYVIKNAGAGTITIDPDGSEEIDDVTTYDISTQYGSITIQSTGSEWVIIGSYFPPL